jgi:hypothetical protein
LKGGVSIKTFAPTREAIMMKKKESKSLNEVKKPSSFEEKMKIRE